MSFLTLAQAVGASRQSWSSRSIAESQLSKSAASRMDTPYDIFLSHASEDAEVIAGVQDLLSKEGFSVYVDWIEDDQTDRSRVTVATASLLRERMNHSQFLLYASTKGSPNSRWMPWELGYFDGFRSGKVGILPIVVSPGSAFEGQEYLSLYPLYEQINFERIGRKFGRRTGRNEGQTLESAVFD